MTRRGFDGRAERFGWWRMVAFGVAVAGVLTAIAVARCESSSDFRDFWRTAVAFRETGVIRDDLGVHNYLPFFTIFMAPWSLLPLPVATGLFTLLSLGLFAATVVTTDALLRGGPASSPGAATWVTVLLILPYVASSAVLGQVNLLVGFLVVAAWLLVERGRAWIAGLPLALAMLIKLMPAALLPFLVLTRRWRTAVSAVVATVVLGAGWPLMSLGWGETKRQHEAYVRRAVVDHSAGATLSSDKPRKARFTNQSLPIVLRRLLSDVNADPDDSGSRLFVNIANVPRPVIFGVYVVALAGVVGVSAVASRRGGTRRAQERREAAGPTMSALPHDDHRPDCEAGRNGLALWLCVMLVASPLVWTHYLVLAYWPLATLAYRAERCHRRRARPDRAALLALAGWAVAALLLAWPAARACGAQLAGVLILWFVLARSAFRLRSR